jgi:hypothetical protein
VKLHTSKRSKKGKQMTTDYKFHATLQFNQALCKHNQLGGHTLSIKKFKQLPENEKCSFCANVVKIKFKNF